MIGLIKHIATDNILFGGIITQYLLMFCYQVFIKFPYKRRFTRGIIFLITGILVAIIINIHSTDSDSSTSIISGIIAIFPLFAVKGNGIRGETKWRQDLKSWISSDSSDISSESIYNHYKYYSKYRLKRLLRGSVSPEAIRFVEKNKDLNLEYPKDKIIKPRFISGNDYEFNISGESVYIKSLFWTEPKLKFKNKVSKKYGRISAIDLYVATKVLDDNISMDDLLDVVSVLLKYDWDFANEKKPMFYWKPWDTIEQ